MGSRQCSVAAGQLAITYVEDGASSGWPIVLSHGFPYDIHAFNEAVPMLVAHGAHVYRPYLRGFGPTRFLDPQAMRSGQQAALGRDLVAFLDALEIKKAVLAGYDWGGLASCVVAALWPERAAALVSLASYDIVDIARQRESATPQMEEVFWYQHLFQTERGRSCLAGHRRELCRMLWEQWSPDWRFSDDVFRQTAASFDNPDFVEVAVHAYRFHFGLASGDPALQEWEARLAARPKITVPAVTLDGLSDRLKPGGTADQARMFTGPHVHRTVRAGHNLPQEAPKEFAEAVLTAHEMAKTR